MGRARNGLGGILRSTALAALLLLAIMYAPGPAVAAVADAAGAPGMDASLEGASFRGAALTAAEAGSVLQGGAGSSDTGIPDGYEPETYNSIPAQQFKNVFETDTVRVSGIEVKLDGAGTLNDTVRIRVFNSTTQETEYLVDTVEEEGANYLPPLDLKLHHNYIFFVEDEQYQLGTKKYVHVLDGSEPAATDGPGAYDYKTTKLTYERLTEFTVYKRSEPCDDPYGYNRYNTDSNLPLYVKYKGLAVPGVKFRLVSDLETLEVTSASNGKFEADLIEDVTYMVYIDSDRYAIDPFPIVAKDKSEYREGRYCYNHATCNRVQEITLYDKGEKTFDGYERVLSVKSLKGRVTVEGMNFRHLLILDRILDVKVAELEGTPYEVLDVTAVNPHRWEISKLVGTDFVIRYAAPAGKVASHVYALEDGALREIPFTQQADGAVRFASDSLSLHPFAVQYCESGALDISKASFDEITEVTYTGSALKPKVSGRYGSLVLKEGTHYTLEYGDNVNVGTAKVTVRGRGAFKGGKQLLFKIAPKKVAPKLTLAKTAYVYNGKEVTPTVTVTDGSAKLAAGAYSLSYAPGRKAVGTYRVTAAMKSPYAGSCSATFTINPKGTSLKKLAAGNKRISASWKRQAVQTTGYQLMCSTSKNFKKARKTALVKDSKKTKFAIKGLKSGKGYYVKLRTYKKVGSKTYYSTWSKAKRVVVK